MKKVKTKMDKAKKLTPMATRSKMMMQERHKTKIAKKRVTQQKSKRI